MKNFTDIYQEFQPKILRYLSNLVDEADAADLTQEVFLKVSRALDTFRGESSLATWIYRIATNTAYDHARSSPLKQRRLEVLFDDADTPGDLPAPDLPCGDKV